MKKIIYIIESKFNNRDYHRFGIDIIIKKGYDVNVWDLSPLLRPKYFNNYFPLDPISFDKHILIYNRDDAVKLIEKLSSQDVAICVLGINERNIFLYNHLAKNNVKYGFYLLGLLPLAKKTPLLILVKKILQNPLWGLKKIISRQKIKKIEIKPADFLIVGGKEAMNDGRYTIGNQTKIIKGHTFDYDRFLENERNNKNNIREGNAYAVFLDHYLPHHPDFIGHPNLDGGVVSVEDYYSPLNTFFSFLEENLDLEIIIAAHPRSNYDKIGNPFNNRKILMNSTAHLTKHSKLVITHCSASISFAILYNKPIIFIRDECYHPGFARNIDTIAETFEKKPIDISKSYSYLSDKELIVNKSIYRQYKESFIKEAKTPEKLLWEIFADYLDNLPLKNISE